MALGNRVIANNHCEDYKGMVDNTILSHVGKDNGRQSSDSKSRIRGLL